MFKGFLKGSSNGSSKYVQAFVDYNLKEKGRYMTAEDLLATQTIDPNEKYEDGFEGLQVSDIIQFTTEGFHHWGIYYGNDTVAHLTNGYIRADLLVDVAAGKLCRINNKLKSATNKELTALRADKIIQTIRKQFNKPKDQNPVKFNSEHQVTEWKYGEAFSDTVEKSLRNGGRIVGVVVSGAAGVVLVGPGGLGASVVGYKVGEKFADWVGHTLTTKS